MSKHKKDVVFLCQYFYPEYISSATLPYDTAKGLADAGYEVGALVGYPYEYTSEKKVRSKEVVSNIFIERLRYLNFDKASNLNRIINYLSFIIVNFINIFKLRKYKLIIVYSNPPVLVIIAYLSNILFGNKVVFVSYDVYPEVAVVSHKIKKHGVIFNFMSLINRLTFKRFNKVVALSEEMKTFMIENREIDKSKVVVIPNWFSVEKRTHIQSDEDIFRVSYFGNMGTMQDMDTILNAAYELRHDSKIRFLFAGHGNKKELIEKFIAKHKLKNCKVRDFLMGDVFKEEINKSNVLLVSILKGLEGLIVPSKTYSYYQSGKAVIAIMDKNTDISRDLKAYNAGITVSPGDYISLAEKIQYLSNNSTVVAEMGVHAYELFLEKYTKEKCVKKYISLVKDLVK